MIKSSAKRRPTYGFQHLRHSGHPIHGQTRNHMYFPLLFQVISRSCFCLTPAAPTIVHSVLHGCPDWPVISVYTLRCLLSAIHARGSIQFILLSGLRPPAPLPPSHQKTMILMGKIGTQLCKSLLVSKMVSPNALYDYLINML